VVRLYENIISKFSNTEGWPEEINYNTRVKKGCPISPTLFGISNEKLEDCLEATGCVGPTLDSIVIILLLYVDDIFIMEMNPYDISK
jgi:hypothetical protein